MQLNGVELNFLFIYNYSFLAFSNLVVISTFKWAVKKVFFICCIMFFLKKHLRSTHECKSWFCARFSVFIFY